ncbi:MAG: HAMP domain-containing sensor histidine kinase [Bdellovibrionota bacterium]
MNKTNLREYSLNRIKRLIWFPIGVFVLSLFLVYSYSLYSRTDRHLKQIEPDLSAKIQSEYGLFANEVFLEQWDAVQLRLVQIKNRIENLFPHSSICLHVAASETSKTVSTCSQSDLQAQRTGATELLLGKKKIGSLSYSIRIQSAWRSLFSESLFLSLIISVTVTFLFIQWLGQLIERKIVIPLLTEVEIKSRDAAIGQMAAQVAHDIRSPLAALEIVTKNIATLSEEPRLLIRTAIDRIRTIADDLIKKSAEAKNQIQAKPAKALPEIDRLDQKPLIATKQSFSVLTTLESILSEKRTQYSKSVELSVVSEIGKSPYELFIQGNKTEFLRMISNLINNGVEALPEEKGTIEIQVSSNLQQSVKLAVVDTGIGIPKVLLDKIGHRGASFGKPSGTGLGLYHARKYIEDCGGTLKIKSTEGMGTTVEIVLPQAEKPDWFLSELNISSNETDSNDPLHIITVDDDSSVHAAWRIRLKEFSNINLISLRSPQEFDLEHSNRLYSLKNTLHLVDLEFSFDDVTGLDLIKKYNLSDRAVLVTNRYDDDQVQQECVTLGIRMIPKALVHAVPIVGKPCSVGGAE